MKFKWYLFGLLLITSCNQDDGVEPTGEFRSTDYFPLDIGHIVDYSVLEIVYRQDGLAVDTVAYELREEIIDSFSDDTGANVYAIDRSTRNPGTSTWTYRETWQAFIENNQVIRVEDNLRYIKLRIPLREGDVWDGNSLFDSSSPIQIGGDPIDYFKNWQSKLLQMDGAVQIDGQSIDHVHTVQLSDYESRVERRFGQELYAKGIGLAYRELHILDTQCFECDSPWEEKAERGHIYIQTLLSK